MTRILLAASLAAAFSVSAADAVTFQTIAKTGDVAPGTGGATFSGFGSAALNDTGGAAFVGVLTGTGVNSANDTGIFTPSALVAREGDAAPGTGGATYTSLGSPAHNDAGETAFRASLGGTGVDSTNNAGIFTGSGLVTRKGDEAPGTGGATYTDFGTPALNDAGDTAFLGFLTGAGVTSANGVGIFTPTAQVARAGDMVPGPGVATYRTFGNTALNDAGETAFTGVLTGKGVSSTNDTGIFTSQGPLVREGDPAPGAGAATFSAFGSPAFNNGGEAAFFALLTGKGVTPTNRFGIFTSSALVAREGDAAPGTGGANYSSFFGTVALNDAGETAFLASLGGAGGPPTTNSGLFLSDGLGATQLILRTGDLIDLGGGDLRTVSDIVDLEGLNGLGQLAFRAGFSDGSSAILIADTRGTQSAVIPLPASVTLLLSGVAGLGLVARRRARTA